LKNKKSCGSDGICNEMIKVSCNTNYILYVDIFNLILKSGKYPSTWRETLLTPLLKVVVMGIYLLNDLNFLHVSILFCIRHHAMAYFVLFCFFYFCKTTFSETAPLPRAAFLRFVEKFVTISFISEKDILG
jgi:hypothetical protein